MKRDGHTSRHPVLYSASPSFFSQIARLTLVEMKLPFALQEVDIHGRLDQLEPGYAEINPEMTVPTLVDNNEMIRGSDRIIEYLIQKYPDHDIGDPTTRQRERSQFWIKKFYNFPIEYLTFSSLMKKVPLMRIAFRWKTDQMRRKMNKCQLARPDLAIHYEAKKHLLNGRRTDLLAPTVYEDAQSALASLLEEMSSDLKENRWLSGDRYTVADVVATCFLARLSMIKSLDPAFQYESISKYWDVVKRRQSFQTAEIWSRVKLGHALQEISGTLSKSRRVVVC